VGYTDLDDGFASCEDAALPQRLCDRLGPGAVTGFFWRWQRRPPSPFTPDDLRAGYVYDLAFRQFEVSDTRVFDRPAAGRAFFEGLIRDHLDLGRKTWHQPGMPWPRRTCERRSCAIRAQSRLARGQCPFEHTTE
jgi:hypothetical protein